MARILRESKLFAANIAMLDGAFLRKKGM
jgi:hypothetical protein